MKIINKEEIIRFSYSLVILLLFVCSVLSLVSSHENDNNIFKHNSNVTEVRNILGPFGANLSALLFKSLGTISFYIPIVLFCWLIKIIIVKKIPNTLNASFLPISILLLCALTSISENSESFRFKFVDVGFVGEGIYELLSSYQGIYLTYLVQNNLLFLSIFLFTSMSIVICLGLPSKFYSNFLKLLLESIIYLLFSMINLFLRKKIIFKHRFKNLLNDKNSIKTKTYPKKTYKKNLETNINYTLPSVSLLENPIDQKKYETENYKNISINKAMLENVLSDFNIRGNISSFKQGPIVTLYELKPAPGTKTSTVIGLSDDIARSMSSLSSRISAIPGRDAIGIEIPNKQIQTVFLKELVDSDEYRNSEYALPLVLGKDILGKPVIVDLTHMPHLLVAGTTGSGKSVGINAMILSLLYNCSPENCRLILIDPKMLELSVYKDIPHLLTEVVTDTKKAIIALKWAVKEMEKRYQLMSELGVRNIEAYNERVRTALEKGEIIDREVQVGFDQETGKPISERRQIELKIFPKIVVVVDELADLMITSGREIEATIQRLSQMARAAGIHLIVATQRPSVDVITGTIKSNFPSRISYQVTSKIDSRTILGEQGGEQLLGKGDLLLTMTGKRLLRVHGPFVMTHEVESVVSHVKLQGEPDYLDSVTEDEDSDSMIGLALEQSDELYNQAVAIVCREKKASTSFIQRHLSIGYNRAAKIIEKMEKDGLVSPANHVGRREVLVGKDV